MRRLRIALGVALVLVLAALGALVPAGLPDARILGYDAAEIALWAADDARRARAAGPVLALDMILPALLAAFLLTLLPRGWRWGAPLAYAACDYAENLTLRAFYAGFPDGAALSPWASTLTQAKWAALGVALVLVVAGRGGLRGAA
ncbi:MAG: hypothetical protein ACO2ZK_01905 [Gemmobacter sp.]